VGKLRDDEKLRADVYVEVARNAKASTRMSALRSTVDRILDAVDRHLSSRTAPPAVPLQEFVLECVGGRHRSDCEKYTLHCSMCGRRGHNVTGYNAPKSNQ